MALGTHHYVQIGESSMLAAVKAEDLSSVQVLVPAGAAVPNSIEQNFRKKMRNLKVTYCMGT